MSGFELLPSRLRSGRRKPKPLRSKAAADAAARRDARLREWDVRLLSEFDPAEVEAETDRALRQVETAIVGGGDVFGAWLKYQVQYRLWWERVSEANAAAARLGREPVTRFPASVNEDLSAFTKTVVSQEAARLVAEQVEERFAARSRYGEDDE